MENKSHALMAGLFAILLGVAALLAFMWLRGGHDKVREYVVVTRMSVGGLNPQAQVRYRGIRVGKVMDIRLDPQDPGNILIRIAVAEEVPITEGTTARLAYQGVTGIAHILLLDTGKNPQPLVAKADGLPRIVMTQSLLEELGETGGATLRQAQDVLNALNAILNEENRQRIASTLANLESASHKLEPAAVNLNESLAQLRKLLSDRNVESLSAAAGQAGPLMTDVRKLLGSIQVTTEKLNSAIGDASGGGGAALLPRLNELTVEMSQTSRQLGRVINQLEAAPEAVIWGRPATEPGPGEPGFSAGKGQN